MNDPVLSEVKVGDRLCITWRLGRPVLATADKITPSGRVVTKYGTFRPDGYMYGGHEDAWNRSTARPATEDDIAGIYRLGLVRKIESFRLWDKLSPDDLKAVAALIEKYAK